MAGFFKFSDDQAEAEARQKSQVTEPPQEASDVGMAIGQGFEDLGQLGAGAVEYAAKKFGGPTGEAVANRAREAITRSKALSEIKRRYMSKRAQAALEAPLLPASDNQRPGGKTEPTQSLMDDPLESIKLKAARQVPLILASAIPGSILSGLGAGTLAVAGATGGVGAALGAGDMVNTVNDEIDKMSHDQLMKTSKVYRHQVENGADEIEARDTIKEMVQDNQVPLATLINFGTNAVGPEFLLAKALGGHAARKGLAKGLAEGLLTGFATEGIEGATTAYGQETTKESQGGQAFNWVNVAKQGIEEGAFGGLFGGVFGAAGNVRGPKARKMAGGVNAQAPAQIETVQAGTPSAAEATALAGSLGKGPTPVSPPRATSVASPKTPVGPATIQTPGTETQPPGAKVQKTPRVYKKATVAAGTEAVQGAPVVGPDVTQAVATQATPLVRKRAQAALAGASTITPSPVEAPPVSATPPVEQPPVQPVTPPVQAPIQTPVEQVQPQLPAPPPAPAPVVTAVTPPMVLGRPAATGRVLPDLQAQARQKAEFERQSAKPDEVAGRGRRYEQTEASVLTPAEHQAWRRKMFREAQGTAPSKIAVEATKIRATKGIDLPEPAKERLRELHRQWLQEFESKRVKPAEEEAPRGQRGQLALPGGLVVKDAKKFVREAARSAQEINANPTVKDRIEAFGEILRSAPKREEINTLLRDHPFVQQAAVLKEKLDKGTATEEDVKSFEKAEHDFVSLSPEELAAQARDIEAGVAQKGGTGAVEISAELPTQEEASTLKEEEEVTTKASKSAIVETGTFGKASEVRKPQLTQEEKARLVAQYEAKQRSESAPKPSAKISEAPEAARKEVGPKPLEKELPSKVMRVAKKGAESVLAKAKATGKKPSQILKEKRAAKEQTKLVDRIGWALMDMHKALQDQTPGTDTYTTLQNDIRNAEKKLLDTFGQAEHDRVTSTIRAALTTQRIDPSMLRTSDVVQRILARRKEGQGAVVEGFDKMNRFNNQTARATLSSTVGRLLDQVSYYDIAEHYRNFALGTPELAREMYKKILPRIWQRAGNVPVHFVRDEDWDRLHPQQMGFMLGYYTWHKHAIVLRESLRHGHEAQYAETLLHEATHAATSWAITRDPVGTDYLNRIIQELNADFPNLSADAKQAIDYALTNERELVAEAFSNPRVQRVLAEVPISAELANELHLSDYVPKTIWGVFVDMVRRMLNLPPNTHSALEAILYTTHNIAGIYSGHPGAELAAPNDPFAQDLEEMARAISREPTLAIQPRIVSDIKRSVSDRTPRAGARDWVLNLTTLHQMTQMADRYFPKGLAVKVSDIVEKTRLRRAQLIGAAQDRVVTRMHQLQQKYQGSGEFAAMENIADRATSADLHPDVPLTHPRNKHIKKTAKWKFARAEHADLYKAWHALPDDLKQVWHDARIYLVDQQNTIAKLNLDNIIEHVLGKKDEQLAGRIFLGGISEADKALFKMNAALNALNKAQELKKIKGVYFPKMRRGDYVITGRYKLPQWEAYKATATKTGQPVKEARYVLHDTKTHDTFIADMRARGLTITGTSVYQVDDVTGETTYEYTDPVTGKKTIDPKTMLPARYRFTAGDTGTHQVYEVTVQDKLVEMRPSEREALQVERALREDKNYEVHGVEKRRELAVSNSRVTSRQIRHAMKTMEQSGGWKNMSDVQKNATRQAMLELSLSFVGSTAPQNRARPRRNVIGASKDLVRNVAEYSAASSASVANLENMPELEKAFDALDEYAAHNRQQTSDITLPRSQLVEKMRQNAYADDGSAPTKRNRYINALLAISFMDKLVSPAYHMINSLQPWMISVPVLGGRHGFARATYELGRAYKDMGFVDTLKSGVKDTKRAVFDLLEGTTDYMADIRKRLAKQKDGAELADMIDYLHDRGLIDKDAGLEVAELINAGNFGEHLLHRVDHVVRQFGTAVEVVNRVTTAIAAYRMERGRGASVDDARVYAQQSVANTQGNYSMSNAPRIFKHPLGRAALQFKKFAQLQYFLLSKLTYNAFKGASPQERAEAAKGLAALLLAHVAIAGATGLPTEPIKIPWMILSMFLPMPTWEEIEQGATEYAQEYLGGNLGDAVTHGLPRLAGIDLSSRVGLNSLVLFGQPRSDKANDVKAWAFDTIMGAPIGLGVERVQGMQSLFNGDFGDAAEKLAPFKVVSDAVKAYRRASEGTINKRGEQTSDPWGLGAAAVQTLGFKPAGEAQRQERTSAYFTHAGNRKAERQGLLDEFTNSSDRASVRRKILKYNASVPATARISMKSLQQLLKRKKTDRKKGYIQEGVYGGKLNKDLLQKYIGE